MTSELTSDEGAGQSPGFYVINIYPTAFNIYFLTHAHIT